MAAPLVSPTRKRRSAPGGQGRQTSTARPRPPTALGSRCDGRPVRGGRLRRRGGGLVGRRTRLRVKLAESDETARPGTVYLAPPDRHLLVGADDVLSLSSSELVHFLRPPPTCSSSRSPVPTGRGPSPVC
ncbi:chemotaxis protein CheB [Streptomyces sp. M19]